jgi:hypothetical protein
MDISRKGCTCWCSVQAFERREESNNYKDCGIEWLLLNTIDSMIRENDRLGFINQ